MSRVNVGWVAVALGCSCASGVPAPPGPEPAASSTAAITAGAADASDAAVVALVSASGTTLCSGTVVAPHVVLSAAHCATADVIQGATLVFGASVPGTASIPVAAALTHPQFDPGTLSNDVAILVLASPAPVAALPLASTAPDVGATVQLVGWGTTAADAGDTGTRRQGTSTVTAVAATTFDVAPTPSQPCDGDSGGPALATVGGAQSVVGVTSHGDAACVQGATYERVDAFLATFIQPMLDGHATPGQRCLFPEQCAGGASTCIAASDDPDLGYCTTACQHDSDCPSGTGMTCDGSQCRYPTPTPGTYGAACASDGDCVEGECTTTNVCALRCVPSAPTCPDGSACVNTSDIDFFCIASPQPAPAKKGGCTVGAVGSPEGCGPLPWMLAGAIALGATCRRKRRR